MSRSRVFMEAGETRVVVRWASDARNGRGKRGDACAYEANIPIVCPLERCHDIGLQGVGEKKRARWSNRQPVETWARARTGTAQRPQQVLCSHRAYICSQRGDHPYPVLA